MERSLDPARRCPRRTACRRFSRTSWAASTRGLEHAGSSFLTATSFSRRGMAFSRVCRSARISSVLIVSMSSLGETLPSTCTTSSSLKAADDLADRVGLADVREELVAQALALARRRGRCPRCRRTSTVAGQDPLRSRRSRRASSSRGVGHADDADVRLDRRERVVRREHVVLGQGVEQGRLADVGQTDDSDGERHGDRSLVAPGTATTTWPYPPRSVGWSARPPAAQPPGLGHEPAARRGSHDLGVLLDHARRPTCAGESDPASPARAGAGRER